MKIVALTPVKNEEWILPTFISSMKKIADEIIILDDNSSDKTNDILRNNSIKVIHLKQTDQVNMSQKRLLLLEEGRKVGGTHFIWLDADESFDYFFLKNGRNIISKLLPGQKLALPWITLWKSVDKHRIDTVWKEINKDVIVYDLPEYTFEDKELSEARTQGPNNNIINLNQKFGVILHFQFLNFKDSQLKQAWYRCVELIQSKKSPRKINNMYSITLDSGIIKLSESKKKWFKGIKIPENFSTKYEKYINDIVKIFNTYNIRTFEPLDIWHIKELKDMFIKETGREPKVQKFPLWLIYLNNIKNYIKNKL